ncbi:MAG: hypothetical protein ACFB6S_17525 [Geminicoccaceae bacterium]
MRLVIALLFAVIATSARSEVSESRLLDCSAELHNYAGFLGFLRDSGSDINSATIDKANEEAKAIERYLVDVRRVSAEKIVTTLDKLIDVKVESSKRLMENRGLQGTLDLYTQRAKECSNIFAGL